MGAGHTHITTRPGSGAEHRGRLAVAFVLLLALLVAEVAGGLVSGSLALLSDAGHLSTDVLGIGLALAAVHAVARGVRHPQRTFGLHRLEVLAGLANAVLLAGVAVWVVIEAVRRLGAPVEVLTGPMFAVAGAGLVANLVAFALLRAGAGVSLAIRGAYLEVVADTVGSAGVLLAAVVIQLSGWQWVDSAVAVAVGLLILPRTYRLGREAVRILTQTAPAGVDVAEVAGRLGGLAGVVEVHDVHVWTLTSGMDVVSAHLTVASGTELATVLDAARRMLRTEVGIDHATLQVEPAGAEVHCAAVGW